MSTLDDHSAYNSQNESDNHRLSDDMDVNANQPRNDAQDEEMSDLFGEDDVEEHKGERETASPLPSGPESERLPSAEREHRQALEYEEEDVPQEIIEEEIKEAEVSLPNLPVPKPSDGDNWVLRIPNYMSVDSKPFHPETYLGPEHDDEDAQGTNIREKSMSIKLKVENTLRWRWTKDELGQDQRQSNARVIRWSDGSLSLRVGKEFFDIDQAVDTSAGVSRQTLGASQPGSQPLEPIGTPTSTRKNQGLTYLVAQHKRSQVLQAEAVIAGHMSLRPTGMQSETHRMLVRAVSQRHKKSARMKMTSEPTIDPELEKLEMIKQSAKKTRRTQSSRSSRPRSRIGGKSQDHDIFSSDDDDEGGGDGYGFDDDDDDGMRSQASPKKGGRRSGGEGEDYQADDFVVPDESDDENRGSSSRKKRARPSSDAEDDLERMEADLEKQAAAKRQAEKKSPKAKKRNNDDDETEDEDAAMDVESEEEDDFKVRRVSSKRAVAFEEEEED